MFLVMLTWLTLNCSKHKIFYELLVFSLPANTGQFGCDTLMLTALHCYAEEFHDALKIRCDGLTATPTLHGGRNMLPYV
jgi:hypothetical protein